MRGIKRVFGCCRGFTLVELLAVIVILGVLASIAVPFYLNRVEKAREDVCQANRMEVSRHYEMQLLLNWQDHSDALFNVFLNDNSYMGCLSEGVYRYVDGRVFCSEHGEGEGDGDWMVWGN